MGSQSPELPAFRHEFKIETVRESMRSEKFRFEGLFTSACKELHDLLFSNQGTHGIGY
jgi:hypothetical protein